METTVENFKASGKRIGPTRQKSNDDITKANIEMNMYGSGYPTNRKNNGSL